MAVEPLGVIPGDEAPTLAPVISPMVPSGVFRQLISRYRIDEGPFPQFSRKPM
jgi:hypothetical protein